MTYLEKFRKVESNLRPRNKFNHEQAVELLATVVHEADEHIAQLEEEKVIYLTWLILSFMTIVVGIVAWAY